MLMLKTHYTESQHTEMQQNENTPVHITYLPTILEDSSMQYV